MGEQKAEIIVHGVEFASGQEPEQGDDFVTLVRVDFEVKNGTLAKVVGKQRRVLQRYLESASPREVLRALLRDRDILLKIRPAVRKFVENYIKFELEEALPGKKIRVDEAEESDLPFTVRIDVKGLSVRVEAEFDALGES